MGEQDKVINIFLGRNQQLLRVEWDNGDLVIFFKDQPNQPYSISEFKRNSPTRVLLQNLHEALTKLDESALSH